MGQRGRKKEREEEEQAALNQGHTVLPSCGSAGGQVGLEGFLKAAP